MSGLSSFLMSTGKKLLDSQLSKQQGNNGNGPQQQQGGGYDNQQGMSGYGGGYPQGGGYNPQQGGGYGQGGYPPQAQGGYPPQGGYNQGGYPPQGGGYPPQGGYPGQQGGYPTQQPGYPPQGGNPPGIGFNTGGYPQQQQVGGGYPSPSQGGFPSPSQSQGGYPPTPQGGYPQQSGGYPPAPQGGYPGMGQGYGSQPGQGYGSQPGQGYGSQPGYGGYQQPGLTPAQAQGYGGQSMLGTPSIRPKPDFNANTDAEVLRKAMKGLGCNNTKVIQVLCARTNGQRQEISRAFKVMYGKDLIKELKGELSGDFEDLILALMTPPAQYDAEQLHKAMAGLGTKESVLIEIMTSRTNAQIYELRNVYKMLYKTDLEKDLISETSGFFKRLLVSMCAGGRDESNYIDNLRANQDARKLYSAGERRLGTDEACFNAILASQNFGQLRMVFDEYQKVTNHPIEKAIDSEFSGDIRDGLLAVVSVVRNRPAYFAKLLHDSMKGLGTRDNDLIRLVVTRCEIDMADTRAAFQAMYKTTLENMIKGDCSGSYKDGLIALVNGNAANLH